MKPRHYYTLVPLLACLIVTLSTVLFIAFCDTIEKAHTHGSMGFLPREYVDALSRLRSDMASKNGE